MTRYARSKGSKSSNERLPNEATPWYVMKQQLESTSTKGSQTKTRTAKQLLADREDLYYSKSLGNLNTDWAVFEDQVSLIDDLKKTKLKTISKSKTKETNNSKKSHKDKSSDGNVIIENKISNYLENNDNSNEKKLKRKKSEPNNPYSNEVNKKKQKTNTENVMEYVNKKNNGTVKKKEKIKLKPIDDTTNPYLDKKCRIKIRKSMKQENENTNNDKVNTNLESSSKNQNEPVEKKNELSKRQKRNQKRINKKIDGIIYKCQSNAAISMNGSINKKDIVKNASFNHRVNNSNNSQKFPNAYDSNIPRKFQKKVGKIRDDKEHARRKPENSITKVMVNGMDIEIARYDGFPILKTDADRLSDLKRDLIFKGIPKSEVDAAMKLERRRCEKAVARIKKTVCFHCRQAGHNLSECPDLEKEEITTGICFKCGSTEHTHFQCKVNRSDDYRFARCFICREPGHIARQCPDNPKGLYPDGGSCKVCGDVTHLKKDCPELVQKKEESTITLDIISSNNLEYLD